MYGTLLEVAKSIGDASEAYRKEEGQPANAPRSRAGEHGNTPASDKA